MNEDSMSPRDARRICGAVYFHAGQHPQRTLFTAIANTGGNGIQVTPRVLGVSSEDAVEATYAALLQTCAALGVDHHAIIERGPNGRFYPGVLTRLQRRP